MQHEGSLGPQESDLDSSCLHLPGSHTPQGGLSRVWVLWGLSGEGSIYLWGRSIFRRGESVVRREKSTDLLILVLLLRWAALCGERKLQRVSHLYTAERKTQTKTEQKAVKPGLSPHPLQQRKPLALKASSKAPCAEQGCQSQGFVSLF